MEDVKKVCSSSRICVEVKAHFYIPPKGTLIKATRPIERLSIDFKEAIPSVTSNMYLLVVIDKYLWFLFGLPYPNLHTTMIIKALDRLFSLTGMLCSDRGASNIKKNDPYMDQVELLNHNPTYVNIKYPSGRDSTVPIHDLAA